MKSTGFTPPQNLNQQICLGLCYSTWMDGSLYKTPPSQKGWIKTS